MRESLRRSIAGGGGFDRYPKGSVVLCNACSLPVFKLDRAISLGDKMGQAASAFKPLSLVDLSDLLERDDADAGVRALVRSLGPEGRLAHVQKLREMHPGDPALCPSCGSCFLQVLSVERDEALDRAYTVEMLTVPPKGLGRPAPVRGRQLGATKDWVH